jgi:hypothetical protein
MEKFSQDLCLKDKNFLFVKKNMKTLNGKKKRDKNDQSPWEKGTCQKGCFEFLYIIVVFVCFHRLQ